MKKSVQRVVSSALALSMMASTASPAALAAGGSISIGTIDSDISSSTEEKLSGDGQLVIADGYPDLSHASSKTGDSVYYGTSWNYDTSTQTLTLHGSSKYWDLGGKNEALKCNVVIGTAESSALASGWFLGNVRLVNGSVDDGVFEGNFTNEASSNEIGFAVFQNRPTNVSTSIVRTSDSSLSEVCVGSSPNFMLSGISNSVYVPSGKSRYFALTGLTKDALFDINGYVLNLHENTDADTEPFDNFFHGRVDSSMLVDVLKDDAGNKIAKVYYMPAAVASDFWHGQLEGDLFFVLPLDETSREYDLNAAAASGLGQLEFTGYGQPDTSKALYQKDSVYYGINWNYDQSSDTLTLTGNPNKDNDNPWNFEKGISCNVVIGTAETPVTVEYGKFYGNVRLVNGSVSGIFGWGGTLIDETDDENQDNIACTVFPEEPANIKHMAFKTADSSFENVKIGPDLDYMLHCNSSNSVYIPASKGNLAAMLGLTSDMLKDINGQVLNLHKSTVEDAVEFDDDLLVSDDVLVDVLKDEAGNKIAKLYYMPASAAFQFTEGLLNEDCYVLAPLDAEPHTYELNQNITSDPNLVTIGSDGYPDLSKATSHEGSVYYGTGWNYDTSTQTLTLTENTKNSHDSEDDIILGTKDAPVLCKVVVGTSDHAVYVRGGGYFAGDVTLVNGQIYRGVFYESAHFTNLNAQDHEDFGVGYCVFANEPNDDVGLYSKVTTNDAALAAKMETCMDPVYSANYTLPGGTVFGSAGTYHMFTIFGVGQDDITDINGQELHLLPNKELTGTDSVLVDTLKNESGVAIAQVMYAPAEMAKETFNIDKSLIMIIPMDNDVHTFELNQNSKVVKEDLDPSKIEVTLEGGTVDGTTITIPTTGSIYATVRYEDNPIYFDEFNLTLIGEDGTEYVNERPTTPGTYKTKVAFLGNDKLNPTTVEDYWTVVVEAVKITNPSELPKNDEGTVTIDPGAIVELPEDSEKIEEIKNEGTIASGNFGTVTGGTIAGGTIDQADEVKNISGGTVQEAKKVETISGGTVASVEEVTDITGGTVQEAKTVETISGGTVASVEEVKNVTGGTVQEAKKVETISGGTVAYVEEVTGDITGGVVGAESNIPDAVLEDKNPAVLKLVDEQGQALLNASVNNVIIPQGGAAIATFALENDIADDVKPVAYIFDGTNVTVRYTGTDSFGHWTVDGIDSSKVIFSGETASFSLDNVNGQTVTFTAHPKSEEPSEESYTIKVEDGLINGQTSASIKAGDTVSLTVGEIPDGMAFQYWDIPTELMQALVAQDSEFSNKVEKLTFTMPDLSSAKDKSFTIRAAFVNAEIAEEDDPGSKVLSTATAVVAGGTAATVIGWQLYNVGTELYLKAVLPNGTAIPSTRQELALLLWQNAGKPDVAAAPYADVANAETDIQKATRWAVSTGLMDVKDNDLFAPAEKVSRWTVIKTWKNAQKLAKQ